MRLANGIIIDKEKTFGVLKFSALRREVHMQNEDGTVSEEIKERTYDLCCPGLPLQCPQCRQPQPVPVCKMCTLFRMAVRLLNI